MSSSISNTGDLVSRYFERVLGIRQIGSEVAEALGASLPVVPVDRGVQPRICLLIEVGSDSETPSIQEMGSRLTEALRNEFLKHVPDQLPEIEWLQADEESWPTAISDYGAKLVLAVVCGARQSPTPDSRAVHVPSFKEMQSSHVLKREAWRAMQSKIAVAAEIIANSAVYHDPR